MNRIKLSILSYFLLAFLFLMYACEKNAIDIVTEEDTTEKSTDEQLEEEQITDEPDDLPKHKLLEVCEETNYFGSMVIREVDRVMSLLKTTKYTLTNYITDVEGGRLEVDCSKYLETILKEVSLNHYTELPKSSKSGLTSLAKDYYNHFVTLPTAPDGAHNWIRIMDIADARPGDIISYIHDEGGNTTGHVMIICSYPALSSPVDYSVIVNDAAASGHFDDTRNNDGPYSEDYTYIPTLTIDGDQWKYGGVGIGMMWFRLVENSYYRWSSPTGSTVYKDIAIGRMIDINFNSLH